MLVGLRKFRERLLSTYWLVPSLLICGLGLLAVALIEIDRNVDADVLSKLGGDIYRHGVDGSRLILSMGAGAMATIATTAFSIVIVALQLASSQYGPRMLKSFFRDRGMQCVIGSLIGTVVYCLVGLMVVKSDDIWEFVPQLTVTVGLVLTIANLGVFVYFIHHVVSSIHVDALIERIWVGISEVLDAQGLGVESDARKALDESDGFPRHVLARSHGYVETIDEGAILSLAGGNDLRVTLLHGVGDFVLPGTPLARVEPAEGGRDGAVTDCGSTILSSVHGAFLVGTDPPRRGSLRTGLSQLVEIALRALSPGVNDPITAVRCMRQIAVLLARFLERGEPEAERRDAAGVVRVVRPVLSFDDAVSHAFGPIRQAGAQSPVLVLGVLGVIRSLLELSPPREQGEILLGQARAFAVPSRNHGGHESEWTLVAREMATIEILSSTRSR